MLPAKSHSLEIQSPLGELSFYCEINKKSICSMPPSNIEVIDKQATVFSWIYEDAIIEVLKFPFIPKLPSNLYADTCICILWRIKALKNIDNFLNFKCVLKTDLERSPESGEGLECQSFENSNLKLSIGTEDLEFLLRRAAHQDWLPSRYQSELDEIELRYLAKGIEIRLPNLLRSECAQLQFIVAWSSTKNPEVSTWYAVDQSAKELLQEISLC